jgi:hypothetical protein
MTGRTQQDDPMGQLTDGRTQRPESGPAILIVGACRGEAFVPAEVLICADTLEAQSALRRWLREHAIHVTTVSPVDRACEGRKPA